MDKVNTHDIPTVLKNVSVIFEKEGYQLRPVGGCVRDLYISRTPKDWDCATNALPEQTFGVLERNGYKPFDISNGHGTVSFISEGETYEITTLRVDTETDGRHATVKFVNDFELDASRRDFTLNAMSCDAQTGELFDYFDGCTDIHNGRIRFVGNAERRIQEDYLRILRYFRFLGKMNMLKTIDADAFNSCAIHRAGLAQISGERIWMEVQQIMSDPKVDDIMSLMFESEVAQQIGLVYR